MCLYTRIRNAEWKCGTLQRRKKGGVGGGGATYKQAHITGRVVCVIPHMCGLEKRENSRYISVLPNSLSRSEAAFVLRNACVNVGARVTALVYSRILIAFDCRCIFTLKLFTRVHQHVNIIVMYEQRKKVLFASSYLEY